MYLKEVCFLSNTSIKSSLYKCIDLQFWTIMGFYDIDLCRKITFGIYLQCLSSFVHLRLIIAGNFFFAVYYLQNE